jgi:anti-sigma regulatory factor (Ser/Thr protein kinase)
VGEKLYIRINNQISEIAHVSQSFNDFSIQNKLPGKISHALDLALDEVLNNIIKYGFDDKNKHDINIEIDVSKNHIKLKIEDDGQQFNPLEVPEADTKSSIEERPIGGLGIHLVRNLMDDVQYKYENNKNCITMRKIFRG